MTFLSLGAGVQSSTMALMAARGELKPMPDYAIFADTQAEPQGVYEWLTWLETQLPFPVLRVTKGSLADEALRVRVSKLSGKRYIKALIPAWMLKPDGMVGLLGRKCTADYKVAMIQRTVRQVAVVPRGCKVPMAESWIGISTDEAHRMKPSSVPWIVNRWPLIEAGYSREACLRWMKNTNFPTPPRSACTFCPFHSDEEWIKMRHDDPASFAIAAEYEKQLQRSAAAQEALVGVPYLHRTCRPLGEVEFKKRPKHQQLSLIGNECEGMCGV